MGNCESIDCIDSSASAVVSPDLRHAVVHTRGKTTGAATSASASASAASDETPQQRLGKLFQRLQALSPSQSGIDRATFAQYFPLQGLLAERLFHAFDTNGNGVCVCVCVCVCGSV